MEGRGAKPLSMTETLPLEFPCTWAPVQFQAGSVGQRTIHELSLGRPSEIFYYLEMRKFPLCIKG